MNIMIHLDSYVLSKAIYQLLSNNPQDNLLDATYPDDDLAPDLLLLDISTLTRDFLAKYPQSRALLIDDIGLESDNLLATLLSYRRYGTLFPRAGVQPVWIDNGSVRVSHHESEAW